MKIRIFLVCLFILLPAPLYAQDPKPGDDCAPEQASHYRLSGGPELSGQGHLVTCRSGKWTKVFSFNANGILQPQFANSGSCADGNMLVYNAATGGISCAAACSDHQPNTYNLIEVTGVPTVSPVESNIVRITGINCIVMANVTGEGDPHYRICSNATCTNIIQDWTNESRPVELNQYIQMRLTSAAAGGDTHTAHLIVGSGVEVWNVTPGGDCDDPDPPPGTICADGTVYAGKSPDGDKKMYTTRCTEGMIWTGMICTGTELLLPWNDYNTDGFVLTGTNNGITGRANTATIIAMDSDSVRAGFQPHRAAQHCANSTANGHNDWYLPAANELDLMLNNHELIGNFSFGYIWSSSETNNGGAIFSRIGSAPTALPKSNAQRVRCVRTD